MKFSIRDILFVVVICALAVGWFLDHQTKLQIWRQVLIGEYAEMFKDLEEKRTKYDELIDRYQKGVRELELQKEDLSLGKTQ